MTDSRPRVLFLCTGNSCRSQMAEAWARRLWGDRLEVHSAGIRAQGLNPDALRVMQEVGVDMSGHRSTAIEDLPAVRFDLVITLCDHARETCPVFPGAGRHLHVPFDDPPHLARGARDETERLAPYRRVRDEIETFVTTLPTLLVGGGDGHGES